MGLAPSPPKAGCGGNSATSISMRRSQQCRSAYAAAHLGNAEIVHLDKGNGQHRGIGKSADMIVLSGNPLEDLKALRAPESVIIKGKLIAHPHPQKNAKMEAMLDTLIA
jgi:hypothetical protein